MLLSRTSVLTLMSMALTAALLGLAAPSRADAADLATTGARFLAIESGARSLGMAGAGVAVAGGVERLRWNPAALAASETQVGIDHARLFEGISHEWIGFGRAAGDASKGGRLAIGLGIVRSDPIEGRDATGLPTVDLNSYGVEFGFTWSQSLAHPDLRIGTTIKGAREVVGEASGFGLAMDVGLWLHRGRWQGGIALANLGPRFSFDGVSAPLPRQLRAGVALHIRPEVLLLALDVNAPSDFDASYRVGGEWRLHPRLTLRSGYRIEPSAPSDIAVDGPAFGFTAAVGQIDLDYAYVATGPTDPTHRFGLIYRFGVDPGGAPAPTDE